MLLIFSLFMNLIYKIYNIIKLPHTITQNAGMVLSNFGEIIETERIV